MSRYYTQYEVHQRSYMTLVFYANFLTNAINTECWLLFAGTLSVQQVSLCIKIHRHMHPQLDWLRNFVKVCSRYAIMYESTFSVKRKKSMRYIDTNELR
jgi:hypothetical protein